MHRAFTLIELVMVIIILAILAAVAIPKYINLQTEAKQSAEEGVVGGVRAGIHTQYIKQCAPPTSNCTWPDTLDAAADSSTASNTNPFFDNVLSQGGVTSDWSKDAGGNYTGPATGVYTYDNSTGSFLKQ